MPVEVRVALISLLGILVTGAVSITVAALQARKGKSDMLSAIEHHSEIQDLKLESKIETYAAVTDAKIDNLTREVKRHNGFGEKIPVLETKISALEKAVQEVKHQ